MQNPRLDEAGVFRCASQLYILRWSVTLKEHMRRPMNPLFRQPLRHGSLAVLTVAIVFAIAGGLVRTHFIEPDFMGALCTSATPPWWCAVRLGILTFTNFGVFGYAALGFGLASFFVKGRWAMAAVIVSAVFGGIGLSIYNAYWAGTGLLVVLLRAARLPADQPPQLTPSLTQPRQGEQA